ncbi:MAG TPA: TolC family protein [Bryobacteraceae bacterium]|nr:TolC family protein [Bryobacteraceae bacterium]
MRNLMIAALLAAPLSAQQALSLQEAIQLALKQHPSLEAGRSGVNAAETRVRQARSGYLPKLNYAETFLRTNNPVVVFSSLLTQHQFAERNFAINTLNRPDALNNFQSQLTVDQVVFDAGQTRHAIRSAELGRSLTQEDERRAAMQVIANVARAYHGAMVTADGLKVADEAVLSAEADLNRARTIREAGMSTDADVLSIQVHLAAMREQQIRRRADLDVARSALNEALGLPLDTDLSLVTPLTRASFKGMELAAYEKDSLQHRPELRQTRMAVALAETQGASARSSLLPQVIVHAGFEADRQQFLNKGGSNWLASGSLRWNLFNGGADKARIDEAAFGLQRARAQQKEAESQIRLDVRRAYADFRAAEQRIEVAEAAVAQAEESLRITKNRFETGLTGVTDLLRTETAALDARTRRLSAVYDQRLAAVNLAFAAGTLTPQSEVVN